MLLQNNNKAHGTRKIHRTQIKGAEAGEQREYKTMLFKAEEYDEETGIFSGYGSVFGNIDSGGDIVESGAFTKTLEEGWERVKILTGHNDCLLPIGKPLELREDKRGLYIKAKISDTAMGRDVKVLLKDRVLNELSIGYDPVVFDFDDKGVRHLREVKLWEVSVVTWAMNPEATITDYKTAKEAAERINSVARGIAQEQKEGRKISGNRLKNLEAARDSMSVAVKAIDAIIQEAREDTGKSRLPRKSGITIGKSRTGNLTIKKLS